MIPGAACDESGLKGGAEGEEQEREREKRRILQVSPPPCTSKKEYPVGVTEIRESFARLKGHGGLRLGGSHARHEAQLDGLKVENAVWLYVFPLGRGLQPCRWSVVQVANVTANRGGRGRNCLTNTASTMFF